MRQGSCCECGHAGSIRSFYDFNGKVYCEPCVWKASAAARDSGQPAEYVALYDHTVCARCGATSDQDFPLINNNPFCPACGNLVQHWPYPGWLKWSFAGLLLLLVLSLVNSRKYFAAGRSLYIGERLVEEQRYAEAKPRLQQAVQVAPGSDKAVLLMAKAALLSGDVGAAHKAIQGHDGGRFEDVDDEYHEVDAIWNRAIKAVDEANQATTLAKQEGKEAEAAKLMHDAASTYPEMPSIALSAEYLDEGAAFERKDYDTFLSISEDLWQKSPGGETAGALASALAAKYAVSGDQSFRQRSEEMLEKARLLTAGKPESEDFYREYSERIRYRLESREIIDKPEYDRRFRLPKGKTQ